MRALALITLPALAASCSPAAPMPPLPPPTSAAIHHAASPPRGPLEAPSATARTSGYAGHGAESVPPEVLARFAPPALEPGVSRRIESMLDLSAPVGVLPSTDGKTMYFTWSLSGSPQVWRVDGPKTFPVQLTGGEDVSRVEATTPDGKRLVVLRDRKGEENPGLYVQSAAGGPLTLVQHLPKVQTLFAFVSDDSRYVYFRANDVRVDSYAIYRWSTATHERELVFSEPGLWSVADHDGARMLLTKATGARSREVWEYDESTKKLTPLFGQGETEEYEPLYAAQPGELLVETPKFGEFRRLYRVKRPAAPGPLDAKAVTAVTPDVGADVSDVKIDRARRNIYVTLNDRGFTRAHVFDAKTFASTLVGPTDAAHVSFGGATPDGRRVVVNVSRERAPTTAYLWDSATKQLTQWLVPSAPETDPSTFAVAKVESYPARDGTKIPVLVRRPDKCDAPCPVVVLFHGGPEGQSKPGFNVLAQLFVDAGFVFLEPNVRGSDGYGKKWLHADDGPKRLDIVTDIEDAAKWARATFASGGKAPKVGIMGGSYGGYSTLLGMTKFAGAYDAGVAIVGMSSLLTFLENTAPYRRALRTSEYGDPVKDREALVALSPITYIDKLDAPILLIQGATDPRVPVGEAIQMHGALARRGVTAEMIVFPDEGHGAQKRKNRVLMFGHSLAFLEAHLKGRTPTSAPKK